MHNVFVANRPVRRRVPDQGGIGSHRTVRQCQLLQCQQKEQLRLRLLSTPVDSTDSSRWITWELGKGETRTGPTRKRLGPLFEEPMDGQQPAPVGGWVEGVNSVLRNWV